ncbi:pseudouridylate synthase [Encephalitozoon intestinalis ATCC 50506]|uniref:Pseudouridylate synthase n=1 Tax=Encephalitozoon intestinalis (strain ATCC 50506) TaxID=876142 RepID=E0S790_ENCIT|nr:pseudouridylate synthase [Encephalitozoon intestinalis ATCC 50506]ADM11518.1 pseudouridylate synthase [Encephalitozoon intestinalis ATCC 50506]UTX45231.1 pseudouridylate synthase [Encephalitozoon intestinalis]
MAKGEAEYFFTFRTNVKGRWCEKPVIDVLASEFRTRTKDYFLSALECGAVTVNEEIVEPGRILRIGDVIRHTVHIHEPAHPEIDIIREEQDYVVVNKPPGMPCHPTGGYREYSVTRALFGDKKVACINRLDMPVSGVLIVAVKNHSKCLEAIREARKIYLAKVQGLFPDSIDVDKKISCAEGKHRYVSDEGKACLTLFRRLAYKDGHSLVECRPITGRTHQIRIHLQSIGFPIVNDIMYGDGELPQPLWDSTCNAEISGFEDKRKYEYVVRSCKGRNNRSFVTKDYYICLHAWKYTYNGIEYVANLPEWCKDWGLEP